MRFGVIVFPGSNGDHDALHAFGALQVRPMDGAVDVERADVGGEELGHRFRVGHHLYVRAHDVQQPAALDARRHRLALSIIAFEPAAGPVPASSFNRTGTIFAYAVSYDWSKGHTGMTPQHPNKILLHACKDDEVKRKPPKR